MDARILRQSAGFESRIIRIEAALAHVVKDKAEAAYFRSDLFEQRRRLMEAWEQFATTRPASVVEIRAQEKRAPDRTRWPTPYHDPAVEGPHRDLVPAWSAHRQCN